MGWFGWLFQQPPAPWQWVGLIIGVLAFVGVIVSIPILFCGRPKLRIDFNTYDAQDGTCMICEIWNEPITKGILAFLKVHRDQAQDVVAFYTVKEGGSGRVVFKTQHAAPIKTQAGVRAERVALPASFFPANFLIALANKKDGQVILEDQKTKLEMGEYTVEIKVENEGKQYIKTGILNITDKYPFAYWN